MAKKELEKKQRELERKKMEMEQKQLRLQQEKRKPMTSSSNNHSRKSNHPSTNHSRQSTNKPLDSKTKPASKISKPNKKMNTSIPVAPIIEKKKPVHMSYEQLIEKANEVSLSKKSIPPSSSSTISTKPIKDQDRSSLLMNKSNKDIKGPSRTNTSSPVSSSAPSSSLYVKRPIATVSKSKPKESTSNSALRTRDRIKLLHNTPLQQVQRVKRDRQSIEEIQRDLRHAKGKYSDDEDGTDSINRKKHRMMADQRSIKNNNRPIGGGGVDRMNSKMRPPPSSSSQRALPSSQHQRQPIRMPFRRAVDPKKEIRQRSRYQHEDEDDEEMDEFIVDDDDEEVIDHHYNNDYSSEISKLFRYDRSKFAHESVYSDDDMEAGASEVLREEKRSERLARKEDEMEEKLEMERQQRRLAKAKRK
ncbi:unnamed protein product [Cunninghamella blakesleeana]